MTTSGDDVRGAITKNSRVTIGAAIGAALMFATWARSEAIKDAESNGRMRSIEKTLSTMNGRLDKLITRSEIDTMMDFADMQNPDWKRPPIPGKP